MSAGSVFDFVAVVMMGLGAIGIGGPLTVGVFRFVDRAGDGGDTQADSMEAAGELLRGGAWIGCLERAGAYTTVVAGWPEGLALIIAVKGLGRYAELRHVDNGTAERFIIGTLVSMLFACACAGLALTFVGGMS
ncbi:MAG: hypothetical protein H0V49_09635 [Nocardioidaceae bacterium]|nr:hypothetical protein [Nocardioidaceae bacterium]